MPDTIRDGTGDGFLAGVDADNRLTVVSKSEELQHVISKESEQAYQVIGSANLASGVVSPLFVTNTSNIKNMIITYIRYQIIDSAGGTSLPNVSNYFSIKLGGDYVSGGTTATPINVFEGSGNDADVTAHQGNPTLSGTVKEIDKWYTKADGDMNTFNKEGAVIIGPGRSIGLTFTGDQTGGIIYSRLSFLMEDI